MIIVEQDKTYLVNFDNVEQVTLAVDKEGKKYAVIVTTTSNEEIVMGIYKTEERAKEVLGEIVESYTNWNNLVYGQPTGVCSPKYEMPKE